MPGAAGAGAPTVRFRDSGLGKIWLLIGLTPIAALLALGALYAFGTVEIAGGAGASGERLATHSPTGAARAFPAIGDQTPREGPPDGSVAYKANYSP